MQRGTPKTLNETLKKDSTPADNARMIRQAMWGVSIVIGLWGALEAYELMRLELGWADRVPLWQPVGDIYAAFGFWPAVLLVPGLGLLAILSLARKLRTLKERQTERI